MEFRVLGPLEVIGPRGPLAIASARQRAVLALLVLDLGRTVASDRLVDEIWGEDPPPSALHALRVHVAGLRRALGPDRIQTQPGGYQLRTAGATWTPSLPAAATSNSSRSCAASLRGHRFARHSRRA